MTDKKYMKEMDVAFARLEGVEMNLARSMPLTLEHRNRVIRHLDALWSVIGTVNVEVRDENE